MKLSIVISAFNEEEKIEACLKSASFADEIIVVDNSSTDRTADIANKYTKKVYTQKNDPTAIDLQKNFGIEKATGDWILILDADEVITPELAEEIERVLSNTKPHPDPLLKGEGNFHAFWIPRKNIIFGKWIEHSGWYPDPQLRLLKKGKGRFEKKHVHEPLEVEGQIGTLSEHILHYNYDTVSQFFYKSLQIYAPNEAEELLRKGYLFEFKDIIRLPLREFLSRYFAREGYKDGFHGLVLAVLMAFYHLAIFVYLWEKKDFKEVTKEELKHELGTELKNAKEEVMFWVSKKKIEEEKNRFKKIGIKLKHRLNL